MKETLGDEWLTNERFRIGASSLLNDLLMQYQKTRDRALRATRGLLEGVDGGHPGTAHEHRLGLRAGARVAGARAAARLVRAVHRRRVRGPGGRHARAVDQPGDRGGGRRGRVRGRGGRAARGRGGARRSARLGRAQRPRARQVPVPRRAADPGARARARGRRVDGRRQADPRVARRGRAARRRALLPLRRLGRQALLRDGRARGRAARRGRRRSCRGTSRCSWPPGSWRPRSRAGTPRC